MDMDRAEKAAEHSRDAPPSDDADAGEGEDCLWVWDPSAETLETFFGDSLHRPPPSTEEMAEMREAAKTDPVLASVLNLRDAGGLDIEAILNGRRWRLRDDFRLFEDEPEA